MNLDVIGLSECFSWVLHCLDSGFASPWFMFSGVGLGYFGV